VPTTEVVVTLKAPALNAFGRSLLSAHHRVYKQEIAAAQRAALRQIVAAVPSARVRWRYRIVADGFALVVPTAQVSRLSRLHGLQVWPNVRYHSLSLEIVHSPELIGADKLWGAGLATAGNGIKIGIIDDGIDAAHPFFSAAGLSYPTGFPKGQTSLATPKVIVQRAFAPANPPYRYATAPFDPTQSFHATHVAGIAAGDHGTSTGATTLSGIAPNAYLGN
jgi:minor extracellular serine protease Vpr